MKKTIGLLLLLLTAALAQGQGELIRLEGEVSFESEAPLELIQASSNQLQGVINKNNHQFAFSVKVNSFLGFNSELQREHFNENYLETHLYENATYSGKILSEINWEEDGEYEVKTKGIFNIHGKKMERILTNRLTIKNGEVTIFSDFIIPLVDHNIRIPKIVEKKIATDIKVTILVKGIMET